MAEISLARDFPASSEADWQALVKEALEAALKTVHLDWGVPIELDFGPPSRQAAMLVANYAKAKGLAPGAVNIRFGFDPFGAMATRGLAPKPWSELAPEVTGLISNL